MQKIVRLAYELPDHPGYLGLFAALGAAPQSALEGVAVRVHEAGQAERFRHPRILSACAGCQML